MLVSFLTIPRMSAQKLTDNVFEVLGGQGGVLLVRPLQLLNAHDYGGLNDPGPLGRAEVLKEFADFARTDELLLQVFECGHLPI